MSLAMEFVKQLWQHSITLRVVVGVAIVGMILAVLTADPSNSAQPLKQEMQPPEVLGKLRERIPGMGDSLPSKAGRTANKAVDAVEDTIDTATKAVGIVDRVVEKTAEATDSVLKRKK